MKIRDFTSEDASFCFTLRSSAFIQKFYDEAGAEAVSAGVNAYMPEDYVRLSEQAKIFIVEDEKEKVGFVTVKKVGDETAEIPFIYFDLKCLGKGFGRQTMAFVEDWIRDNWATVKRIFLDTIIPAYNGEFYRKMGYRELGESFCTFSGKEIKAARFEKIIKGTAANRAAR